MNNFKAQNFIAFISTIPNVKVKAMKSKAFRITYKNGVWLAHSWAIWNHVKSMYENNFKEKIEPDDVNLKVFDEYIEVM